MFTDSHYLTRRMLVALLALVIPVIAGCEGQAEEEDLGFETETGYETDTPVIDEGVGTLGFADWDANEDSYLDEDEFETGWEEQDLWDGWDTDRDSYLSEDEYNTAFSNESWYDDNLYGDWDANDDDLLDEDEFRTGLYDTWDADDDQRLAENEFDLDLF